MPIYMNVNPLTLNFKPAQLVVPIGMPEVQGFGMSPEPTQADADAAAEALAACHASLPPAQQAVIEQILAQAGEAAIVSAS